VTFNGHPVTSGTVQLFLADGATLTSEIAQDGSYAINNIPTGPVSVGVSSPNPKRRYDELLGFAKTEEQRNAVKPPDPAIVKNWVGLPEPYARPESSGLTATIKSGPNQQDFPLTGVASASPKESSATPLPPARTAMKK
jgi:hypothetical protein